MLENKKSRGSPWRPCDVIADRSVGCLAGCQVSVRLAVRESECVPEHTCVYASTAQGLNHQNYGCVCIFVCWGSTPWRIPQGREQEADVQEYQMIPMRLLISASPIRVPAHRLALTYQRGRKNKASMLFLIKLTPDSWCCSNTFHLHSFILIHNEEAA